MCFCAGRPLVTTFCTQGSTAGRLIDSCLQRTAVPLAVAGFFCGEFPLPPPNKCGYFFLQHQPCLTVHQDSPCMDHICSFYISMPSYSLGMSFGFGPGRRFRIRSRSFLSISQSLPTLVAGRLPLVMCLRTVTGLMPSNRAACGVVSSIYSASS